MKKIIISKYNISPKKIYSLNKRNVNSYFYLLQGRRDYMEDNIFIFKNNLINFSSVFDGHGGSQCSIFLKKNIYNIFQNLYKKYKRFDETLYYTYLTLNKIFLRKKLVSGSTCNTLIINKKLNTFAIANIGDSRIIAYYNKNNKVKQISKDHKPNYKSEKRFIELKGGFVEDNRVNGILAMSRAIGDKKLKNYLNYEPDIYKGNLTGILYFVQASDGLFDVMSNSEICFFINKLINKKTSKKLIVKKLVEYAINIKKSSDNVSVIITFI